MKILTLFYEKKGELLFNAKFQGFKSFIEVSKGGEFVAEEGEFYSFRLERINFIDSNLCLLKILCLEIKTFAFEKYAALL